MAAMNVKLNTVSPTGTMEAICNAQACSCPVEVLFSAEEIVSRDVLLHYIIITNVLFFLYE